MITNIAGKGGMTHNGGIYAPEPQKKDDAVVKDKGKVVVDTNRE